MQGDLGQQKKGPRKKGAGQPVSDESSTSLFIAHRPSSGFLLPLQDGLDLLLHPRLGPILNPLSVQE